MGVNDGRVMASGGGGVATEKTSPKFEICSSVRFFRFFSVFFVVLFWFFLSELRQEIPAIQKLCQQCGLGRPRTAQ